MLEWVQDGALRLAQGTTVSGCRNDRAVSRSKEGKRNAYDDEGLDLGVDSGQVALIGKGWQMRRRSCCTCVSGEVLSVGVLGSSLAVRV